MATYPGRVQCKARPWDAGLADRLLLYGWILTGVRLDEWGVVEPVSDGLM
jgi:hypothetical protein